MPLPKLTFCAPGSECYLLASWFDAPKCAEMPFVPSILESISANSPKSFCLLPFTTLRHPIWCVHVKFYFFPKWKCSRARCWFSCRNSEIFEKHLKVTEWWTNRMHRWRDKGILLSGLPGKDGYYMASLHPNILFSFFVTHGETLLPPMESLDFVGLLNLHIVAKGSSSQDHMLHSPNVQWRWAIPHSLLKGSSLLGNAPHSSSFLSSLYLSNGF